MGRGLTTAPEKYCLDQGNSRYKPKKDQKPFTTRENDVPAVRLKDTVKEMEKEPRESNEHIAP